MVHTTEPDSGKQTWDLGDGCQRAYRIHRNSGESESGNRLELSMASQGVPDWATMRLDARVSVLPPQGPEPQPRAPPPRPERSRSAPAPWQPLLWLWMGVCDWLTLSRICNSQQSVMNNSQAFSAAVAGDRKVTTLADLPKRRNTENALCRKVLPSL